MDAAEANTVMKLDDSLSLLLKYVLHIHIPTTKYAGKYIRMYVCMFTCKPAVCRVFSEK